jgi:hypothetical protein
MRGSSSSELREGIASGCEAGERGAPCGSLSNFNGFMPHREKIRFAAFCTKIDKLSWKIIPCISNVSSNDALQKLQYFADDAGGCFCATLMTAA